MHVPTQFDMGYIWSLSSPTTEDWEFKLINGEVLTWENYTWRIITEALNRHTDIREIHFVNNRYDLSNTSQTEFIRLHYKCR